MWQEALLSPTGKYTYFNLLHGYSKEVEDGLCRATRGMCRSLDSSIPSFWLLALQGNLGKILFSSLARLQQTAGLTQCDIYFECERAKKAHPQHTNVKTFLLLRQTHTHTKSQKTRRASPLFSDPLGTLQEHRGEGAPDLPFSVTSQRSPALLPFHKQPKDRRAGCGKRRSHGEGPLPKQRNRYKACAWRETRFISQWATSDKRKREKSSQQDGITENGDVLLNGGWAVAVQ